MDVELQKEGHSEGGIKDKIMEHETRQQNADKKKDERRHKRGARTNEPTFCDPCCEGDIVMKTVTIGSPIGSETPSPWLCWCPPSPSPGTETGNKEGEDEKEGEVESTGRTRNEGLALPAGGSSGKTKGKQHKGMEVRTRRSERKVRNKIEGKWE